MGQFAIPRARNLRAMELLGIIAILLALGGVGIVVTLLTVKLLVATGYPFLFGGLLFFILEFCLGDFCRG